MIFLGIFQHVRMISHDFSDQRAPETLQLLGHEAATQPASVKVRVGSDTNFKAPPSWKLRYKRWRYVMEICFFGDEKILGLMGLMVIKWD